MKEYFIKCNREQLEQIYKIIRNKNIDNDFGDYLFEIKDINDFIIIFYNCLNKITYSLHTVRLIFNKKYLTEIEADWFINRYKRE